LQLQRFGLLKADMLCFQNLDQRLIQISQSASSMQVEDIPGAGVNTRKGKRGRTSTKQVTLLLLIGVCTSSLTRHHNHVSRATINHEA